MNMPCRGCERDGYCRLPDATTTKKPGHQRQLVPGVNSNPNTQEGEAVMPNLQYESKSAEQIAAGKVTFDEATGEYRSVDLHREDGERDG